MPIPGRLVRNYVLAMFLIVIVFLTIRYSTPSSVLMEEVPRTHVADKQHVFESNTNENVDDDHPQNSYRIIPDTSNSDNKDRLKVHGDTKDSTTSPNSFVDVERRDKVKDVKANLEPKTLVQFY